MRNILAAAALMTFSVGLGQPLLTAHAETESGGVSIWSDGSLHIFGNLGLNTGGAPSWPGWDIARGVALNAAASGGWSLDGFGGMHAWGAASSIYAADSAPACGGCTSPPYWPGNDIARAFVVLDDDKSGYLLRADGSLYPFGKAPALDDATRWPGQDIARGLALHFNSAGIPDGGWILRADGGLVNFGAAGAISGNLAADGGLWQSLHFDGATLYAVARWGIVQGLSGSLDVNWSNYADSGSADSIRDTVLVGDSGSGAAQPVSAAAQAIFHRASNPAGGVVLDGFGGLHPFGGLWLDLRHLPYWPGWDYIRAVQLAPHYIGGWSLGAWGQIYNWGAAPPINSPVDWGHWDIARDLYVLPDSKSGYILDGYGGVHAFGPNAPALSGYPYWAGWDAARGFDIHLNAGGVPDGGWTLDLWGGVHAWGAAPVLPAQPQYWQDRDLYLKLHHTDGAAYTLSRWGFVDDVSGGQLHPNWYGYDDWGSWDILRDLILVHAGPGATASPPQYHSQAAVSTYWNTVVTHVIMGVPAIRQSHPLDCEAAALRAALAARGVNVSEDWILAQMGADTRTAVKNEYGVILQWGNPYKTFVGKVNGSEPAGTGYGVYAPPLAAAAQAAGRPAIGKSGWSPQDIYMEIARGHPVVIWTDTTFRWVPMRHWMSWDGQVIPYAIGEHTVTLVGVNAWTHTVLLLDVEYGEWRTFSMAQFESFFSSFGNMAVAVQ